MKMEIDTVHGHGDASKEWVRLRATEDCDIGQYLIADNTYLDDDIVSNKLRHTYWFPDKQILAGEYVSLRTGKGVSTETVMGDGTTLHRFFWGLSSPVWNDSGDGITLFEVSTWRSRKVTE